MIGNTRTPNRKQPPMKKILAACGVALFTLALATPAFAWHVVSASAECVEGSTVITVDLSDQGAGTFVDSLGNEGSFDSEPFSYDAGETEAGSVTVTIDQDGAEGDQVAEVDVTECQTPTTTTTVPPTTTTVPPVTTTVVPPSTPTTSPVPVVSVPPATPPAPELAATGFGVSELAAIAGSFLVIGTLLVARHWKRQDEADATDLPDWDIRKTGWSNLR